ncbi:MAG: hypothetical protein WCD76_16940 [Pyrinomonadaceae bacterium]
MQALQTMQPVQPAEWEMMLGQATALVKTGFLPKDVNTAEKAVAIMLTGRELNIPPMAALSTINVIQGKPTVSPQLMLALINRSGHLEDMKLETSADGAVCAMKRKGRQLYVARFGPVEAKAMGLDGKDNYKKQAATMYQWRAVAMAARAVFPDVVLGLYTPEEMGADVHVGETGEMTVERLPETAPPAPARSLPPATETSGQDERANLVNLCGQLFRELNAKGYTPKWTPTTISVYINEKLMVTNGIDGLTVEGLRELQIALSSKLDVLIAESDADKSLSGNRGPSAVTRNAQSAEGGRR